MAMLGGYPYPKEKRKEVKESLNSADGRCILDGCGASNENGARREERIFKVREILSQTELLTRLYVTRSMEFRKRARAALDCACDRLAHQLGKEETAKAYADAMDRILNLL